MVKIEIRERAMSIGHGDKGGVACEKTWARHCAGLCESAECHSGNTWIYTRKEPFINDIIYEQSPKNLNLSDKIEQREKSTIAWRKERNAVFAARRKRSGVGPNAAARARLGRIKQRPFHCDTPCRGSP